MPREPLLPPQNIFFYRDGVSEGEFEQVAQQEIPMIKGVASASMHVAMAC